jgi:thymidylate kinase
VITSSTSGSASRSGQPPSVRGWSSGEKLVQAVFDVLDGHGIPYCILHSYRGSSAHSPSDVDCIVPREFLPSRLAEVLRANRKTLGAALVQWIQHESTAHYFVLRTTAPARVTFLCLDVSSDYRRNGRVFYRGEEILASRRLEDRMWVPSPALEFGCYLVKKILKRRLSSDHGRRLTSIYEEDPTGCVREIDRFWRGASRTLLIQVAASGDWERVQGHLKALRREIVQPATLGEWRSTLGYWIADARRRLERWREPTGLHVVFLGSDGAGKTTTLTAVKEALAPAFRKVRSQHLAPALLRRAQLRSPANLPHDQRPRSLAGSLTKAAYWLVDYSLGYHLKVRPLLACSTLVLFDRYVVDAVVDPVRYRYGGPPWVLRLVWSLVPKPDLVILLEAPVHVLRSRKQEVHEVELQRQCGAYRELVSGLSGGRTVDAAQPLDKVVTSVSGLILDFLQTRTQLRVARRTMRAGAMKAP